MSKSHSGLFRGTKGDRIAQKPDPRELKKAVVAWAEEVVRRMPKDISKKKRDRFNTACVVFDETTGKLYFGRNGGIEQSQSPLHPTLKKILPSKSLNNYFPPWNCAESDAINQALHDGSKLKNMHIYVIDSSRNRMGKDKKSCKNCTDAFKERINKNYTGWQE